MITRGARKFVFLGRSGTDKAPARRLVEDLQQLGAKVKVVRSDVASANDVTRAVEAVKGTIGGVIQAAMGLGEALFTAMPQESWQPSLAPKIQGTWNLHNAIRGRDSDLDFFLMTSSVSRSVGTATESNYCSASYFLDTFARYRQSLGLPATAIGLGMISGVGYLHENPEIEAMLLRKGIQAISEDEMLQIVDISLSTQRSSACDYDVFFGSHVLTGLEAIGLKELKAKGFEGVSPVMGDPRASLLAASLDWTDEKNQSKAASGLPSEVAAAMESGEGVREAVLSAVPKKFSNLVLVREDKLDVAKPIGDIGVDSMLAAEFRSWIFQTFKADVPYLALLATSTTLAKFITESISSHD
ncbi:KR-domain-containing protein [Xylaria cubensis]|nr:KR-domain-containing protein [Xylaria cubensis]